MERGGDFSGAVIKFIHVVQSMHAIKVAIFPPQCKQATGIILELFPYMYYCYSVILVPYMFHVVSVNVFEHYYIGENVPGNALFRPVLMTPTDSRTEVVSSSRNNASSKE